MSASPAGFTPGRTPNDGQPPKIRRPKPANPLVLPKKRNPRPPVANGRAKDQSNGSRVPGPGQTHSMPQHLGRPASQFSQPSPAPPTTIENGTSGFSSQPMAPFRDYPLVLSKQALADGFRHHVARFSGSRMFDPRTGHESVRRVDPRNEEEFVRPVRLHRRDPRAPPGGAGGVKAEDHSQNGTENMDEKEREKQEILKAERDAKREVEMAQVAPSVSVSRSSGKNMKKTEQIYRNDQTEEQKKRSQLRYEEAMPWHLEDFDNKNTWVGNYEAALSDTYSMIIPSQDANGNPYFRLVPLEKWYKFTQKNQFKALTADEAEVRFNKKIKEPRWFMDSEESKQRRKEEEESKKLASGLFIGKWERGGGGSGNAAPATKHGNADVDDLDFQEDRFADDEDNVNLFEEDDDNTKDAKARIEKDQLQANVFDLKEEKEYEKQEKLENKEKELEKRFGKRTKKTLIKREKNYIYDSDSTDNPYSSESESDDTETERLKGEERKKAEEAKSTPEKEKASKPRIPSDASTKATSTPSKKHDKPLKTFSSISNLKRPGSPLNSEASGNESSRKKQKKKHPLTSSSQPQAQANSTLQPPLRTGAPPLAPSSSAPQPALPRKTSGIPTKRPRGPGSGSDTDGGAGSGGDMSDGARKRQKLKLNMSSNNGTPQGSRSGSPERPAAAPAAKAGAGGGSRAGSPAPSAAPADTLGFPTAIELRAQVPASGITTVALFKRFKGRITGDDRQKQFMAMVKTQTKFDLPSKLVFLKPEK